MEWQNLLTRELGLPIKCRDGDLPESLARKLELSAVLNGHTGCVNRLAWNQDGSLLASASDDCQVLLWHYPDTCRVPIALETEHRANLFGVAILPFSNNCQVVSGSMDSTVQLHELGEGAFNIAPKYRSSLNGTRGPPGGAAPPMRRHPPSPQVHVVKPRTTIFQCHRSRVKEVEVCLSEPSLFWSAGEDGVVRQYDARTPNQKAYSSANVLVNLMAAGPAGGLVECKGLSVNQQNPNLMAVACGDPYVRLFDRRRLNTCRPGGGPTMSLLQLTAPHLPLELAAGMIRRCHATHCSFSHRGDRLVASYHGDHAYVFDVTGAAGRSTAKLAPQQQQQQRVRRRLQQDHASPNDSPKQQTQQRQRQPLSQSKQQHSGQPGGQAGSSSSLPEAADIARVSGNNALFETSYTAAIGHFTAAIAAAPNAAGLYTQRALALLKRGWEGDAGFALHDCEAAMELVSQQQQQQRRRQRRERLSSDCSDRQRDSSYGASSSSSGSGGGSIGGSSVEQQARLRLVHALKQLGQVKCALAALDSYRVLYPTAASSNDVATLENFLQQHLQRRLAYKRKLGQSRSRLRHTPAAAWTPAAAGAAQQQQQQQQQPTLLRQQGSSAQIQQQQSVTALSRSVSSGGVSSSGGSSRSASPLGSRPPHPPGRGVMVDTDVDSDDLEGVAGSSTSPPPPAPQPQQQLAAPTTEEATHAASAGAAAGGGGGASAVGCIGPVLPQGFATATAATATDAAAAAAVAAAASQSLSAAATAAAAAPEGMEVDPACDSAGGDPHHESDDEDLVDPELPTEVSSEDELLEDELLAPWYGPAVFARLGQDSATAAAATQRSGHQQRQAYGSGGSSSSGGSGRRRPRSSSGDVDAVDSADEDDLLVMSAGGGGARNSRRRNGQQQQQQRPPWWDVFSGGPGRLLQRCVGQCNVQTDIKEAVFLGQDDALVACGSDDGCVFIYDSHSGVPVKVLAADKDVANCVQPHPHLPVLATSGIDTVIKLWAPTGVANLESCERYVTENQARMRESARPLRAGMVPPHILQAALGDNPQLLQMLLQQLYNRPTTPAAAGAGVAAAAGGGGGGGGRGAAAVGVRGSAASEGSLEAGRHDLGPVPGLEIVGLEPGDDDDEDGSESDEGSEGDEGFADEGGEGLEGPAGEGGPGQARRRRGPRRQVQEVTCRVS